MDFPWQTAVGIAGLGAVACFVFWSLMKLIIEKINGEPLKSHQSMWLLFGSMFVVLVALFRMVSAYENTHKSTAAVTEQINEQERRYGVTKNKLAEAKQELATKSDPESKARLEAVQKVEAKFTGLSDTAMAALRSVNLPSFHEVSKQLILFLQSAEVKNALGTETQVYIVHSGCAGEFQWPMVKAKKEEDKSDAPASRVDHHDAATMKNPGGAAFIRRMQGRHTCFLCDDMP